MTEGSSPAMGLAPAEAARLVRPVAGSQSRC